MTGGEGMPNSHFPYEACFYVYIYLYVYSKVIDCGISEEIKLFLLGDSALVCSGFEAFIFVLIDLISALFP